MLLNSRDEEQILILMPQGFCEMGDLSNSILVMKKIKLDMQVTASTDLIHKFYPPIFV